MTGDDLRSYIRRYIEENETRVDWPCWELNDHDAISSQGDFGNIMEYYVTNMATPSDNSLVLL